MADQTSTTSTGSGSKSNGKWKSGVADATDNGSTQRVMDQAQRAYDTVVDKASDIFSGFNASPMSFIRDYPMQSAIGGLIIGYLLGSAVSRRSLTE